MKPRGRKSSPTAMPFLPPTFCLQVRAAGSNPEAGKADLARYRPGQVVIAMADPLNNPQPAQELAAKGVSLFSLELLPRITRGQSMDVLSSMATIAGYRAVLLAATQMTKMFPMLMTAAGTITPAKVFVIGAGVAGLQAIATAKRLGAVVSAYDVRPAVKEQIQSLGGKFVEMELGNQQGGRQRRLRPADGRRILPQAAGVDDQSRRRERRHHHHGRHSRQKIAGADYRRGRARHGAGFGDHRSGGRTRRQLRIDQGGRNGRRKRRDDPRSH